MYPSGHHEAVPLQGGPGQPGGYPGQPGGPSVTQHTVVNIVRESPKDHIIWSICTLFYGNPLCLGLAALIYSVKARDRKVVGDIEGARHYGSTACCLNTAAVVLISLAVIISIIVFAVTINRLASAASTYSNNYNRYNYRY